MIVHAVENSLPALEKINCMNSNLYCNNDSVSNL